MKVSYYKSFKVKAPWNNLRGRQEIVLSRHPSDLLTSQKEGKENENKKGRKDLTASQHFSVSRELTEKSSPGWIWWKVTSAAATKTSAITNISHKSSFSLSIRKTTTRKWRVRTRELPSGLFSEPTLRVKLTQRRNADLAFVFFKEKHFGHQGLPKKKKEKEKERKTNPALSHLHKKIKLC